MRPSVSELYERAVNHLSMFLLYLPYIMSCSTKSRGVSVVHQGPGSRFIASGRFLTAPRIQYSFPYSRIRVPGLQFTSDLQFSRKCGLRSEVSENQKSRPFCHT
jgi:hypothetical protein